MPNIRFEWNNGGSGCIRNPNIVRPSLESIYYMLICCHVMCKYYVILHSKDVTRERIWSYQHPLKRCKYGKCADNFIIFWFLAFSFAYSKWSWFLTKKKKINTLKCHCYWELRFESIRDAWYQTTTNGTNVNNV